ncbi:MAG: glycosyltransferase family 9 protein [Desulfobacteraceae bacterium]|nr:glycosyltransferase family 9 protein [Desulfobacteraceae bacterium]
MLEPAPEKICLIRTSAVGDTVHALALANGLKQGFPNASLTWVLQTIPYEMVMHQPCVDQFITFDRKAGSAGWRKLIAEEIAALCKCRPVIALEKPIRRTMIQLQGCRLVVSPDTGPLHIAVAMGVPTIGLYGYSNPRRCGPYRFHDLLIDHYNDPDAQHAPITRKSKPGRMQTITPEEVIEKIQYCLKACPDPQKLPEMAK